MILIIHRELSHDVLIKKKITPDRGSRLILFAADFLHRFRGVVLCLIEEYLRPRKLRCQDGKASDNQRDSWAWKHKKEKAKYDERGTNRGSDNPTDRVRQRLPVLLNPAEALFIHRLLAY